MTRVSFLFALVVSLIGKNIVNGFNIIRLHTCNTISTPFISNAFRPRSFTQHIIFAEPEKETLKDSDSTGIKTDSNIDVDDNDDDEDDILEKVELFGKGAAKVKRGKRKGGSGESGSSSAPKVVLTPEEVFYEGPPAITETIVPTISILTVVGIIPAAAAWARQAWVRYKITSRRIRVQSGFGGNEMAEIVYPDIIEIRTVKRLFGDGDMVLFLRDGAKFEMRNVPNFDETMDFILKYVSADVSTMYRQKGDVGRG